MLGYFEQRRHIKLTYLRLFVALVLDNLHDAHDLLPTALPQPNHQLDIAKGQGAPPPYLAFLDHLPVRENAGSGGDHPPGVSACTSPTSPGSNKHPNTEGRHRLVESVRQTNNGERWRC